MKKIVLFLMIGCSVIQCSAQGTLQITAGTSITSTGSSFIMVDNMNVVNNGSISLAGTSNIMKLSGNTVNQLTGSGTSQLNDLVNNSSSSFTFNQVTPLGINNVTLNSGILNALTAQINTTGNWLNNGGSFTPNSGTVNFNGAVAQTVGGTITTTFNNLTLNNTNGLSLAQDESIATTLTLISGRLDLGPAKLVLGNTATAVAGTLNSANMIVADGGGEVRKMGTSSSQASYIFPVGDKNGTPEYSPIALSFSGGSYAGYESVKVINLKHPNNGNSTNFLKRYWTLAQSGYIAFSCNISGTYVPADVVGSENNIVTGKWSGSLPWIKFSPVDAVNHKIVASGVTSFSDWSGLSNPTVSISPLTVNVCVNTPVTLTANAVADAPSYLWSTSAITASINPPTTTAGTINYIVTVTDVNGFTATDNRNVTVGVSANIPNVFAVNPGGAPFTIYKTYGPQVLPLTVNAIGNTPFGYSWTGPFIQGPANAATVNVGPSSPGNYNYSVLVTDGNGCTTTKSLVVRVLNVSCGGNKIYLCQSPANTICLGPGWAPGYLAQGYTMGQCGVGPIAEDIGEAIDSTLIPVLGGQTNNANEFIAKISPNPSNASFSMQVVGGTDETITVRLIDAIGRVLYSRDNILKGQLITFGQNLKAGSYFAQVIKGINRKVVRLIKLN